MKAIPLCSKCIVWYPSNYTYISLNTETFLLHRLSENLAILEKYQFTIIICIHPVFPPVACMIFLIPTLSLHHRSGSEYISPHICWVGIRYFNYMWSPLLQPSVQCAHARISSFYHSPAHLLSLIIFNGFPHIHSSKYLWLIVEQIVCRHGVGGELLYMYIFFLFSLGSLLNILSYSPREHNDYVLSKKIWINCKEQNTVCSKEDLKGRGCWDSC